MAKIKNNLQLRIVIPSISSVKSKKLVDKLSSQINGIELIIVLQGDFWKFDKRNIKIF